MTYPFSIHHSLPERTRIRWAGDPGERGIVAELASSIEAMPGVLAADARPHTGSIIIEHEGIEWQNLRQSLDQELSLQFCDPATKPAETGLETFNRGVSDLDRKLHKADLDLTSMTFLFLMVMAVSQAIRGQFAVSGFSFLWYALTVASKARSPAAGDG